jgi:hypothetical protein
MNQAPSLFTASQPEELKGARARDAVISRRRPGNPKLDFSPSDGSVKIKLSDRWP